MLGSWDVGEKGSVITGYQPRVVNAWTVMGDYHKMAEENSESLKKNYHLLNMKEN